MNGRNVSANKGSEQGYDLDPSVDCNVMISGEKGIDMYNNQTHSIVPNSIAYVSNKRNLDQNTKELDS